MNSRNEMKVIRDVSCTNGPHCDSELWGVGPNPLDFGNVMEKIRGKTGPFFFFFLKSSPTLDSLLSPSSGFLVALCQRD